MGGTCGHRDERGAWPVVASATVQPSHCTISRREVLHQLHDAHLPVLVVFMSAGTRVRTEAVHHHADGYLAKPFALTQLLAVVAQVAPSAAP